MNLSRKITAKKTKVGIIGMGYVGAALADLIVANGFDTLGFVKRKERADSINKKKEKLLQATTDVSLLKTCDVILICVQTPVDENKLPDLRFLEKASLQVAAHLQKDQLVIIESSIATGTTRNIVLPLLEKSSLTAGKDYFLAFSPERVDPGNKQFDLGDIPKVVAGLEKNSQDLAVLFYTQIMKKVIPVSSLETAEMVKLFENTFRLINISFVNELSVYAKSWGIDMWEVVQAASSKPFGFLAHYPSPGIGGHCIPVDPFYMLDDAKKRGIQLKLIEEAGKINDARPQMVVDRAFEILESQIGTKGTVVPASLDFSTVGAKHPSWSQNQLKYNVVGLKGGVSDADKNGKSFKILLIGLSYKPDIDDIRESASLKIWELLEKSGSSISYHDPYVPSYANTTSKPLSEKVIREHDLIIIVTNHSNIDYNRLAGFGKPILDTQNVFAKKSYAHVFPL